MKNTLYKVGAFVVIAILAGAAYVVKGYNTIKKKLKKKKDGTSR